MVSQTSPEVAAQQGRGFMVEETVVSTPMNASVGVPLPSFWGAVVAGTVVAISIGAMSSALMFGCHVGTAASGAINFGAGAAIWVIVTACIAYFFGGMVASRLSMIGGAMRGLVVWGLSIPLNFALSTFFWGSAGLAYAHTTQLTQQIANNTGSATLYGGDVFVSYTAAWIVFVALVLGLAFAVLGAMSAGQCSMSSQHTVGSVR